jgi:integrase
LHLSKSGYRASTIRSYVAALKAIAKRVDLLDPDIVKEYLAKAEMCEGRKEVVANNLKRFYSYRMIPFEKPRYRRIQQLPFIPLESEVDALIAGVGKKSAAFLQLIKETGARAGEAWNLRWIDIDFEANTVNITPEKHSEPRRLKLSTKSLAMLNNLPHKCEYVFRNPKSDSIKTLRHWKATTLYHKTKDILLVQRTLGHRNLKNTLVYTHLIDFKDDEFVCKAASTVEEAKILIEDGFEYVTDFENLKLFRKRK